MTRRVLTDEERIASIREVIEAARGDWHEATALLSVGADLNWLLERAAVTVGGLDVARLERALTTHRIGVRYKQGPDAYLDHSCMGDCAESIVAEYAHQEADQ